MLLPGTAPEWKYFGGIVRAAWTYAAMVALSPFPFVMRETSPPGFGAAGPLDQLPQHLANGDPRSTWRRFPAGPYH
jgi:hypothetical protein